MVLLPALPLALRLVLLPALLLALRLVLLGLPALLLALRLVLLPAAGGGILWPGILAPIGTAGTAVDCPPTHPPGSAGMLA